MGDRYCKKCMMPIGVNETCPYCGFSEKSAESLPAHILPPGTILSNRYLLGEVLGQGGFGITYIGRDLKLDMRVAVKEYYPNGYVNRNSGFSSYVSGNSKTHNDFIEKGISRFLQEAKVLAQFHGDPGIVDVRDYFEENGTAYIVMEFLEGSNLRECLNRRLFTADEIFKLFRPVFTALEKIHANGVIHRDISPDNIMMLPDGELKLMDFGAARFMNANDQKSLSVMLKTGYAPEEQYRTKGKQGPWTDIYALCATIYKCITGKTPDDALERLLDDRLEWPSNIGIAIMPVQEEVLKKGMAVLSKDRYQNLRELVEALETEDNNERFLREAIDSNGNDTNEDCEKAKDNLKTIYDSNDIDETIYDDTGITAEEDKEDSNYVISDIELRPGGKINKWILVAVVILLTSLAIPISKALLSTESMHDGYMESQQLGAEDTVLQTEEEIDRYTSLCNQGELYFEQGEKDKAFQCFIDAAEENSEEIEAYMGINKVIDNYIQETDIYTASRYLAQAIEELGIDLDNSFQLKSGEELLLEKRGMLYSMPVYLSRADLFGIWGGKAPSSIKYTYENEVLKANGLNYPTTEYSYITTDETFTVGENGFLVPRDTTGRKVLFNDKGMVDGFSAYSEGNFLFREKSGSNTIISFGKDDREEYDYDYEMRYSYTYDEKGNLINIKENTPGNSGPNPAISVDCDVIRDPFGVYYYEAPYVHVHTRQYYPVDYQVGRFVTVKDDQGRLSQVRMFSDEDYIDSLCSFAYLDQIEKKQGESVYIGTEALKEAFYNSDVFDYRENDVFDYGNVEERYGKQSYRYGDSAFYLTGNQKGIYMENSYPFLYIQFEEKVVFTYADDNVKIQGVVNNREGTLQFEDYNGDAVCLEFGENADESSYVMIIECGHINLSEKAITDASSQWDLLLERVGIELDQFIDEPLLKTYLEPFISK